MTLENVACVTAVSDLYLVLIKMSYDARQMEHFSHLIDMPEVTVDLGSTETSASGLFVDERSIPLALSNGSPSSYRHQPATKAATYPARASEKPCCWMNSTALLAFSGAVAASVSSSAT